MRIFIDPNQNYLQVNQTALIIICVVFIISIVAIAYQLIFADPSKALIKTSFIAIVASLLIGTLYTVPAPVLNYQGEQVMTKLVTFGKQCGVQELTAYKTWLETNVLPKEQRQEKELSETYTDARDHITVVKKKNNIRLTCGVVNDKTRKK